MKNRVLRMKKRMRVAILVILFSLLGLGKGYSYDFSAVCPTGQTLYYSITNTDNHYVMIVPPASFSWGDFPKPIGNITIPESVTFNGISYTVTAIGSDAFYNCSDLTGPLLIPNSVISIGNTAFCNCSGFTSLTIPNSVISIGYTAFKNCNNIIGTLTIPNSVTSIGVSAFEGCSGFTGPLVIPNSVESIYSDAFSDCTGINSLTIGSSARSIEDDAFTNCPGLEHIFVESSNSFYDSRNDCNAIIKTSNNELIVGCKNTIIPNTITSIGSSAFTGCSGLVSITIPSSVVHIPNPHFSWSVFDGCSNLTHITIEPGNPIYDSRDNCNAIIITNTNTLLIGCKSTVIPESVTRIGAFAFFNCVGLHSISIPESVTFIGEKAFVGTGLSFNQSEGILYLDNCCLGHSGYLSDISNINIQEGTRLIAENAFRNGFESPSPYYINTLTIPSTMEYIYAGTFGDCYYSELRYNARNCATNSSYSLFPNGTGTLVIGNTVETIPPYMFRNVHYTGSLIIPNSVTTIREHAFDGCSGFTGSLTIGESVSSIGLDAFKGCDHFSSLIFNAVNCNDIEYNTSPFEGFSGTLSIGNEVQRIPVNIFKNTGFTGLLTIPNSVTSIGNSAFYGCSGFNGSLVISNSVTEIGHSAFYNCRGFIGELVIPNSVVSLGGYSFYGCTGLSGNLTLSNSLLSIAPYTFFGCTGISSVSIPNSVLTIESNAFNGCTSLTSLSLPASLTTIGDYAFNNCTGISGELIFPNSVTYIGAYAFTNCHGITTVSIPVSVLRIGAKAFANCSSLREIDFYSINCNIDPSWLDECNAFEVLNFGNNVQHIPGYIFTDCLGLKSVNFPESLKEIGEYAFKGCKELTSLMIPDSVLVIGDYAFYDCQKLTSVVIGKSVNQLGSMVWGHCTRLTNIYYQVEKDLVSGATPFNDCPNLTTIHIDPCVLEIGSEVFRGCLTVHFIVALGNTPAILDPGAFEDIKESAIVMVSCGNKINYFSNWNMFAFDNIIEDCDYYGINVGSVGSGGNITSSAMEAQMGQEVQLTIKPNPGMGLASLKVCNANDPSQIIPVSPSGKATSTFKFTMPPFEVVVIATFKSITSVNENITASIPASVYPNPTTGLVKIEAEDLKHVTISNMLGQVFYQGKASGGIFEYDFNGSETGIYFIVIETASGITTKRVVVTR